MAGWTSVGGTGWYTPVTAASSIRWGAPPPSDDPRLVGDGPAECSSCTALSVLPAVIYDVNGYYRELGVHVRATRKELRLAYQAKDGQSSARLTYIFRQLLSPETRFAYDCTPLGELFMDDYVREMISRRIKAQASQRMQNLSDLGVDLEGVDVEAIQRDIAAEMGYGIAGDTPSETVDETPVSGEDAQHPAKFEYAYYLWRTSPRSDATSTLMEWQRFLVSALAKEGLSLRFAVGLHGEPHRWLEAVVGYRRVFFINHMEVPTPELARDLARRVRLDREATATPTLANTER